MKQFEFVWGHLQPQDLKIVTALLERVVKERGTFVSRPNTASVESIHAARYASVLPKGRTYPAIYAMRADISVLQHENRPWALHLMKSLPFEVPLSENLVKRWEHDAVMRMNCGDCSGEVWW